MAPLARFLVVSDELEMLRPVADHESLSKIAANSDGRFALAEEGPLVQVLDELKGQVNGEVRGRRRRTGPTGSGCPPRTTCAIMPTGLWNSFALVSFMLFAALLGCEWLLRRLWGFV